MARTMAIATLALVWLASWPALRAMGQDSGPGPIPPATEQTYEATFFRFSEMVEGSFTFFSEDEPSDSTFTSGTFESTIAGQVFSGSWRALDLGNFAFWLANGDGDSDSLLAFGFATPDNIVGRATLRAANGGFWSFLRAFFGRSYLFFGEAVETVPEPEPTEPMEPMMDPA